MRHCVLIPARNEAEMIEHVVKASLAWCPRVLVVDDASEDDTAVRAAEAGALVLRHSANAGKSVALATGFRYLRDTQIEGVITLNGNGEHDPSDVPRFIALAEEGNADVIVGCRMGNTRRMRPLRLLTDRVVSRLVSVLSGQLVLDAQCGYRWIRRSAWERIEAGSEGFDGEAEFLIHAGLCGFRIVEIPVATVWRHEPRRLDPVSGATRFFRWMTEYVL